MNNILHLFNLHLSCLDHFNCMNRRIRFADRNTRKLRRKNKLYRDILRGLKRNELMVLHANVKRIEKIIDAYMPLENIFVKL